MLPITLSDDDERPKADSVVPIAFFEARTGDKIPINEFEVEVLAFHHGERGKGLGAHIYREELLIEPGQYTLVFLRAGYAVAYEDLDVPESSEPLEAISILLERQGGRNRICRSTGSSLWSSARSRRGLRRSSGH